MRESWYNQTVQTGRAGRKGTEMNDKELIDRALEDYAKLQRIITADDPRAEAMDQKRIVEAKLQAYGVVTEKLKND